MATSVEDITELEKCFTSFVRLSAAGKSLSEEEQKHMNSKACGKMVSSILPKNMQTIVDASVFPKHKEKTKQTMPLSKFPDFISDCALEYAKMKEKNTKLTKEDPLVKKHHEDFLKKFKTGTPNIKETKISKSGNVENLTDHKKYTGSHKGRFDESGRGKGAEGRVDKQKNTGYVSAYKGEGTHGTK